MSSKLLFAGRQFAGLQYAPSLFRGVGTAVEIPTAGPEWVAHDPGAEWRPGDPGTAWRPRDPGAEWRVT